MSESQSCIILSIQLASISLERMDSLLEDIGYNFYWLHYLSISPTEGKTFLFNWLEWVLRTLGWGYLKADYPKILCFINENNKANE